MEIKNAQLIQGLRDLLAFIEANEDFDFIPSMGALVVEAKAYTWYLGGEERQRLFIADITRRMAHAGKVEKLYSDDYAWLRLQFGPFVKFDVTTMRDRKSVV